MGVKQKLGFFNADFWINTFLVIWKFFVSKTTYYFEICKWL